MSEQPEPAVDGGAPAPGATGVPPQPPPEAPPPPQEPERRAELVVIDALPGLARIAAGAWVRSAAWGVGASLRLSRRLAEAALAPELSGGLVRDVGAGLRNYARELLGITDLDDQVRLLMPASTPSSRMRNGSRPDSMSLREQGAELLRQSADVSADDETHPAYERILKELAPDEARILRLLARSGPQASVDVRAANLIGVGSQLVAPHLNMMGTEAGCRHVERVPAYLNNLQRLGLIWFSDIPVEDIMAYQVIEAQPDAIEALRRAGRAKTAHRSIRLTAFGKDFCNMVLPETADDSDLSAK
jgi:hypothetical protein